MGIMGKRRSSFGSVFQGRVKVASQSQPFLVIIVRATVNEADYEDEVVAGSNWGGYVNKFVVLYFQELLICSVPEVSTSCETR